MLSIYAVLVKQLNIFPRAVKSFDEQMVSFRRVERLLLLPEVCCDVTGAAEPDASGAFVSAEEACGDWVTLPTPAPGERAQTRRAGSTPAGAGLGAGQRPARSVPSRFEVRKER